MHADPGRILPSSSSSSLGLGDEDGLGNELGDALGDEIGEVLGDGLGEGLGDELGEGLGEGRKGKVTEAASSGISWDRGSSMTTSARVTLMPKESNACCNDACMSSALIALISAIILSANPSRNIASVSDSVM